MVDGFSYVVANHKESYNGCVMSKQIALIVLPAKYQGAKTPFFDWLWNHYPHTTLTAVDQPTGKIIDSDLVRIHKAIASNQFVSNLAMQELFNHVKKHKSTLHVKGLLGEGGVHAHNEHLFAFLRAAKEHDVANIAIHVFLGGEDSPPQSGADYLEQLEEVTAEIGVGYIATATGRFYAMNQDSNWDRLHQAEQAMWSGQGKTIRHPKKASKALREIYAKENIKDDHVEPIIFLDDTGQGYQVAPNDGIFIFNFRADQMKTLTQHIAEKFSKDNVLTVTMTEYGEYPGMFAAFPKVDIETTLSAEISKADLSQAHIAEADKFPHATYFLNGGRAVPNLREEHIMLPERKDATNDLSLKVHALGIADKTIEQIAKGTDFIFVSFADLQTIDDIDFQLKRVVEALIEKKGVAFITTEHSKAQTDGNTNSVPVILTDSGKKMRLGVLTDITPTILALFNINKPAGMAGESLLL